MATIAPRVRYQRHWLRPVATVLVLLALGGCVVEPAGYYGGPAAYPAPAYAAYPAYPSYYAPAPVGVVVGGGWGRGWGGYGGGWHRWH